MIAIIDYGMGNLRSVEKGFEKVGHQAQIVKTADEIRQADAVVLPGVGAFGMAMEHIKAAGLDTAIIESVASGKPFLGICLGLQLLFDESEEFGPVRGLGIIPGKVVKFFPEGAPAGVKIPHMGWNGLNKVKDEAVLQDIPNGEYVYFVHSYYVVPNDDAVIATTTEYGGFSFTSSISNGNLYACQFHPEKSGTAGLTILKRFAELTKN
ncbi:MAG: imidazole glycerol phosphate synthase subunit HisH [bacterium]